MQKMVKQEAESTRVAIRQARRDAMDRAKAIVSKNDKARAENKVCLPPGSRCWPLPLMPYATAQGHSLQVQGLTDKFNAEVNTAVEAKEAELANIV